MNAELLQKLGINDEDPNVVYSKLGAKEIELLDKRDLAETNGAEDRVKEIDSLLEQLKAEGEVVKEEAKSYISKKDETVSSSDKKKAQTEKKNDVYERWMQKKKEEVQEASKIVINNSTYSSNQQTAITTQANATKSTPTPTEGQKNTVASNQSIQPQVSNTQTQNQQSTQTQKITSSVPTASGNSEYSAGLKYYQKQDFANAFKCFLNVTEAKNVPDQTAAQERTQASYLLAVMYRDGVGTNKDIDRSNHYLKRAADFGYDQAQLEYGEYALSTHNTSSSSDLKARAEGIAYIEKAANSGLIEAQKKFIDFAMNSSDADKKTIEKAKKLIPQLKTKLDSYEAHKCDDWLNGLQATEKNAKKKASYPKKLIIGEILFLIGTIYLFKGMNSKFFDEIVPQIGKLIVNIPDWMIIKWQAIENYTDPFMTYQGIFGCWLILIGNIVRGLGSQRVGSKYDTFEKVINISVIVLCVMHFIANLIEENGFFGNGEFAQFVVMIGAIIIGRILGWILFKFIK